MIKNDYKFNELFRYFDTIIAMGGIPEIYIREKTKSRTYQFVSKIVYYVGTVNLMYYCCFGELMYTFGQELSMEVVPSMVEGLACCCISLNALVKSTTFTANEPLIVEIVEELEKLWPEEYSDKVKSVIDEYLALSKKLIKITICSLHCLLILFLLAPILTNLYNYLRGLPLITFYPFYSYYPIDPSDYGVIVNTLLIVSQAHAGYYSVFGLVCGDCFLYIVLTYLIIYFKFVSADLLEIADHADDISDTAVEIARIKKCAVRHNILIYIVNIMKKLYSFNLLFNIVISALLNCILLFSLIISPFGGAIKSFILYSLLQIYVICWYAEELKEASEELRDSVYNSMWYNSDKSVKQCVWIIQAKSQIGCTLTAMGFTEFSMLTFTAITKMSWSYFTLLRTMFFKYMSDKNNEDN